MGGFLVVAGIFLLWRIMAQKVGVMTPERKFIFNAIMKTETNPAKLLRISKEFRKEGLIEEADALKARSELPNVSGEMRARYEGAFRKAMMSGDPDAVEKVASAFQQKGMGATCEMLNGYARGLRMAGPLAAPQGFPGISPTAERAMAAHLPYGVMPQAGPFIPPAYPENAANTPWYPSTYPPMGPEHQYGNMGADPRMGGDPRMGSDPQGGGGGGDPGNPPHPAMYQRRGPTGFPDMGIGTVIPSTYGHPAPAPPPPPPSDGDGGDGSGS